MNLHQDNDGFLERAKKENEKLEMRLVFQKVKERLPNKKLYGDIKFSTIKDKDVLDGSKVMIYWDEIGVMGNFGFKKLSKEELDKVRNKEYKKEI